MMDRTMTTIFRRPMRVWTRCLILPVVLAGLGACSVIGGGDDDPVTPTIGNRTPILSRISNEVEADPALASVTVVLPPAQENADWPQAGGNAAKAPGHLSLAAAPTRAWTANIPGSSPRRRLAAAPVTGGGSLFVVDTQGSVHAFDAATGARRWTHEIEVDSDLRNAAFGGGVSYFDGRV